jgi:hypothetical protein
VTIRGYNQTATTPVSLLLGGNSTAVVKMVRGGAISVGVYSYDNRFGTRVLQAPLRFLFLNLPIAVVVRVYFYNPYGVMVGYVERLMVQGGPKGVGPNSFQIIFTGMNWNLRDIWFYGNFPTHLYDATYSIKAYTLGYVPQRDVTNRAGLVTLTRSSVALLIGNEIHLSGPIYKDPMLLSTIPEHDHVIGRVFNASAPSYPLLGAMNGNLTEGTSSLFFRVFGFGGMLFGSALNGQGHFYYVDTDGIRYFDYGLDVGNYTAEIPEFGFKKHFIQLVSRPLIPFNDLFQEKEVILPMVAMAKIYQGVPPDLVRGWVFGNSVNETIPLSWVHVTAENSTSPFSGRYAPTLDGKYDGVGALYLPAGAYNITFSVAFYKSQTGANYQVTWNNDYPLLPPFGLLCPTAGSVAGCDPPLTISSSPSNSAAGAVLLTANLDAPTGTVIGDATYSWSTSRGHLNATTGPVVLWAPSSPADYNATISVSALVKTRSGASILSRNITLSYQAVPEFSHLQIISIVTLFLACAGLSFNRRPRKPRQSLARFC